MLQSFIDISKLSETENLTWLTSTLLYVSNPHSETKEGLEEILTKSILLFNDAWNDIWNTWLICLEEDGDEVVLDN